MGLETGVYIQDLDESNPLSSDKRRFGDDHFRLIKSVLKNTFPNANGVISPSVAELNYVEGVTSAIQNQLDARLLAADLDALITAYGYALLDANNVWAKTQAVAPIDLGNVSGIVPIDLSVTDSYIMTLVNPTTLSFSGSQDGQGLTLKVIQGNGGEKLLTFPANFHFARKTLPTLTSTEFDYDVIVAKRIDGNFVASLISDLG